LEKIVQRLVAVRHQYGTKLLFGLTSPEMCDKSQDDIVVKLNAQALNLMESNNVPTVDLHGAVVGKCGEPPQAQCLGKKGGGCPHYSGDGYAWIANTTLVPAFKAQLASESVVV